MGIEVAVADCDGVLTDNTVLYPDRLRAFNVSDGHGFQMLQEAGIKCYIFSGEGDTSIWSRAKKLGVEFHRTKDKLQTALDLGLDLRKTAFLGNAENDLDLLMSVAFPACPADAELEIRHYCSDKGLVTRRGGGRGAFKDLASFLLAAIVHVPHGDAGRSSSG